MDSGEKSLETLQVWQLARGFAVKIYRQVLPNLPVEEKWSLAGQLRRSVISIPANIAEGYGRYYFQESVRFCYIARGSLEETLTYILLAADLDYIPPETYHSILKDLGDLRRMLNGYIGFLKRSKRGSQEPGADISLRESPPAYILNNFLSDDQNRLQDEDALAADTPTSKKPEP